MQAVNSGRPGNVDTADRELRRELRPVRAHRLDLDPAAEESTCARRRPELGPALERPAMRIAERRRNDECGKLAAENLLLRVSERALGRDVELEDEPVMVDGDHGVERRIEDRARVRRIGAQRCLGGHGPGVAILDHRLTTIDASQRPATPRSGYEPRQSLVGAQGREENDVADRLAAREEHHEAVDPEAEPGRRRHAVGERLDVVRIATHALHVLGLLVEAALLLVGIVDLRVRVAELHAGGEVLEPLGDRLVVVGDARERRELHGMSVDDRRLDEARLDEVAEGVVDELRPVLVGLRVDSPLRQPGTQLALVARPELARLERLDEADALPRTLEVDLVAAERRDRGAERIERDLLEHRLDAIHRIAEVGVRLVPLEHRELGLVLVRDALVAEVLADLVHALEPSDDQALQVELGRDAQVEVCVQLVRVRHERVRERAAVARLEDGRLDLDEPLAVEVATDRRDDLRAQEEEVARLLVHEQVEVALAVARLRVGQAVERVRERAAVACEHRQLVDGEGRLPAPRLRRPARDADDVAEVDVDVARTTRVAHELDSPGADRRDRGTRASPSRGAP